MKLFKPICKLLIICFFISCDPPSEPVFNNPYDAEGESFVCDGPLVDIDGNDYDIVMIGNQCWMAENLKTGRYRNGVIIENIEDAGNWINGTDGAWVHYENNSSNEPVYGKLYNWHSVNSNHGLCPQGWAVPTDEDWKELEAYLGMRQSEINESGTRGWSEAIGGKLKGVGTEYWLEPNREATNTSGFSAGGGGFRNPDGSFEDIGRTGRWWAATESSATNAIKRDLYYRNGSVFRGTNNKFYGFSVRCIWKE